MSQAALARLAPQAGRIAVALLWVSVFSGWLAPRPAGEDASSAPPLRRVFEPVAPGDGVALAVTPAGDTWWITRDAVVRFAAGDPERREVVLDSERYRARFGRALEPITAAHVDAQEGLWLATRRGELLHLRDGRWRDATPPASGTGAITALATRGEEVYVAGVGLWRARVDGGALTELGPFTGMPVDRVVADETHGVAVAAQGRVWRSDAGGWREVWQARDTSVSALALAPDGELWIGTGAGLVRIDRSGAVRRELRDLRVGALVPGDAGVSLAGGTGLFARYAAGWRRVDAAGEVAVSAVDHLAPAPLGVLWVAMSGRGLYRAGPLASARHTAALSRGLSLLTP